MDIVMVNQTFGPAKFYLFSPEVLAKKDCVPLGLAEVSIAGIPKPSERAAGGARAVQLLAMARTGKLSVRVLSEKDVCEDVLNKEGFVRIVVGVGLNTITDSLKLDPDELSGREYAFYRSHSLDSHYTGQFFQDGEVARRWEFNLENAVVKDSSGFVITARSLAIAAGAELDAMGLYKAFDLKPSSLPKPMCVHLMSRDSKVKDTVEVEKEITTVPLIHSVPSCLFNPQRLNSQHEDSIITHYPPGSNTDNENKEEKKVVLSLGMDLTTFVARPYPDLCRIISLESGFVGLV